MCERRVDITKNGKNLVKSKKIDEVLVKSGISPTRYLDETNFDYLLINSNTLSINKEIKKKTKTLVSQDTPK